MVESLLRVDMKAVGKQVGVKAASPWPIISGASLTRQRDSSGGVNLGLR